MKQLAMLLGLLLGGALIHLTIHAEEAAPVKAGTSDSVLIKGVPHVRQKPDFCGEACAEMWLRKLGKDFTQDDVFNESGLDAAEGRGCHTRELVRALARIGFDLGESWHKVKPGEKATDALWTALHNDLVAGIPSIVCMRYDGRPDTTEHFRLILGYDREKDEVIYHEPAENGGAYRRMSRTTFQSLWPLKYKRDEWTVIRMRLKTGEIPKMATRDEARYSDADYAQHVRELKKRLPGAGFSITVAKPFVVVGDESASMVERRAERTVLWAAKHLKKAFFKEDPEKILDVWLFKDKQSYETNAKKLFGRTPTTPYGYYSSSDEALVMNIATGGGTLVHEIVHPYVEANFPDCPSWFNEGLGSLFEQCAERDGKIMGRTNWRLKGLKAGIAAKELKSFEALMGLSSGAFYGGGRGNHYAQSRYLLYYLQEKGLLRKYYARFFADRKKDPTGFKTLVAILGEEDIAAFQKRWEKWVMGLTYR